MNHIVFYLYKTKNDAKSFGLKYINDDIKISSDDVSVDLLNK